MYRQWAAFKLNVSIYRYYIGAGAATYWGVTIFPSFLEYKLQHDKQIAERAKILSMFDIKPKAY